MGFVLDKAGAAKMPHKEIAAYLADKHGVSGWWSQMVTVAYEQARGMRQVHQTPGGYQVSVSKTFPVPVSRLYKYWVDAKMRRQWLKEGSLSIRKATPDKSIRITWSDGGSNVEVNFYGKGASKSQVVVQYSKLPDSKAVEQFKSLWKEALGHLEEVLGSKSGSVSPRSSKADVALHENCQSIFLLPFVMGSPEGMKSPLVGF